VNAPLVYAQCLRNIELCVVITLPTAAQLLYSIPSRVVRTLWSPICCHSTNPSYNIQRQRRNVLYRNISNLSSRTSWYPRPWTWHDIA